MKAAVVEKLVGKYQDGKEALDECIVVKEVPRPVPKFGQVLVKVHRSQINPSDTSFVQGRYGKTCEPGSVPGFEACGTVVGYGGSLLGFHLMGKRVAIFGSACWAEYTVVPAKHCFALSKKTSWTNAAGAIANPLTVVVMCDMAKTHKVVVCTAGTSSLVAQFIRQAKNKHGIQTIAIVRKDEDITRCQELGALHTLNSTSDTFQEELKTLCEKHQVTLAFDSVAGDVGSQVLHALAPTGEIYVYGFLSGKPVSATGTDLIFKQKHIRGLWLKQGLNQGFWKLYKFKQEVIAGLSSDLSTSVQATFPLDQVNDALIAYTSNLSGGKIHLIMVNQD